MGPLQIDRIGASSHDRLLRHASSLACQIGLNTETADITFDLLEKLREHDEKTAKESLQTLPLALAVGKAIENFYGAEVEYDSLWAAALLHDIGKLAVPKALIDRSNAGISWNDYDRAVMSIHPFAGAEMLRKDGFPETVARAVEEHHHKQYGSPNYGRDARLSDSERITRDSVAAADFADAMLNRTNSRNRGFDITRRQEEVTADLHFLFDDYQQCADFVPVVASVLIGSQTETRPHLHAA